MQNIFQAGGKVLGGYGDYFINSIPSQSKLVKPNDGLIFAGSTAATINNLGELVITNGTKTIRIKYEDIERAFVYAPSVAAKQKYQLDLSTDDYSPYGDLFSAYTTRQRDNEALPKTQNFSYAIPDSLGFDAGQKIARIIADFNGQPNRDVVFTANGTDGVFAEALVAGDDVIVTSGGGFKQAVKTVDAGFAFGAAADMAAYGLEGAVAGATYNVLIVNVKVPISLASDGLTRGRYNENRAEGKIKKSFWFAYAVGTHDSQLATAVGLLNPTEARFKRIESSVPINA